MLNFLTLTTFQLTVYAIPKKKSFLLSVPEEMEKQAWSLHPLVVITTRNEAASSVQNQEPGWDGSHIFSCLPLFPVIN